MRKKRRSYLAVAALAVVSLLGTACGDGGGGGNAVEDGPPITVGTVDFAENRILGQIYAQALEHAGYTVEITENIGNRELVAPQLEQGNLDLIVEYTGNALRFERDGEDVEIRDEQEVYDALNEAYEAKDLTALAMAEAQDVDAVVVTRETAEEHGLAKISDIADFPGTFRFGGGPECETRLSCFQGLVEVYGLDNVEFVPLDVAGPITVEALNAGEVDGANLFTTQSAIVANDFVVLEDDQELQLPQNIVPVIRQEIVDA
ncbi:MAG: ABC transporter substrate-binding protein, partial [Actinobacteria bacterium]|nr:ABC transporter substrate-binding protein [Actinomycetota bacterium]